MALFIVGLVITLSTFWLLTRHLPMYRLAGLSFLCTAALCGFVLYRAILSRASLSMLALLCVCSLVAPIAVFLLAGRLWRLRTGGSSTTEPSRKSASTVNVSANEMPVHAMLIRVKAAWSSGIHALQSAVSRRLFSFSSKQKKATQPTTAAPKQHSGSHSAAASSPAVACEVSVPTLTAERSTFVNLERQRMLAAAEAARRAAQSEGKQPVQDAQPSISDNPQSGRARRIAAANAARHKARTEMHRRAEEVTSRSASSKTPTQGTESSRTPMVSPHGAADLDSASIKAFDPYVQELSGESVRLLTPEEASERLAAMPKLTPDIEDIPAPAAQIIPAEPAAEDASEQFVDTSAVVQDAEDTTAETLLAVDDLDQPNERTVAQTLQSDESFEEHQSQSEFWVGQEIAQPTQLEDQAQHTPQPEAYLAELNALRRERDELQHKLEAQAADATQEREALAHELAQAQAEHRQVQQELQAAQELQLTLEAQATETMQAKEQIALELAQAHAERSQVQQELQASKEYQLTLEAQATEAMQAKEQIALELAQAKAERSQVQQELQAANELQLKLEAQATETMQAREQIALELAQAHAERSQVLQELQASKEYKLTLEAQATEAMQAKEQLALELAQAQAEHAQVLQELQAANELQLKFEVQAAETMQAKEQIALELAHAQAEHAQVLQELQAANELLLKLQTQASYATQEQAELALELAQLHAKHEEALQQVQASNELQLKLEAQASYTTQEREALALELAQLHAKHEEVLIALQAAQELQPILEAQAAAANSARASLTQLQAEHAKTKKELQATEAAAEEQVALAVGDARALAEAFEQYKAGVEQARHAAEQRYQQNLAIAAYAREQAEAELKAAQLEIEALRTAQEEERAAQQAQRLKDQEEAQRRLEQAAAREAEHRVQAPPLEDHPIRVLLDKADQLRQVKAYALAVPLYEQCATEVPGTQIAKTAILRKLDCCAAMGDNDALVACAQSILSSGAYELTDAERAKVRLVLNMTLQKM